MSNAIREAIERAAAASRLAMIAERRRNEGRMGEVFRALADDVRTELGQNARGDGRVPASALPTLRAFLAGRLSSFSDRWRGLLTAGTEEAARTGTRLLRVFGRPGADAQIVGEVVTASRTFRAADGLQLSDRIWRADRVVAEGLGSAIESSVALGETSARTAERLLRDGLPVSDAAATGMAAGRAPAIAMRVADLMRPDAPGNVSFNLQRLLRTEMNRAYTEAYVASVAQHPDIAGVRFNLSPLHPELDVCDLYAAANLHGLGPGVYPPGEHPYPAHPMTLSFLTTVWKDEVTDADKAGQQTAFDWIAKQPTNLQDRVLGGQRKGAAFRAGVLEAGDLRRPWKMIAERIGPQAATFEPLDTEAPP